MVPSTGKEPPNDERNRMDKEEEQPRTLREIEEEVLEEGREWMRQRLQQRLQEEADRHGGIFPPQPGAGGASAVPSDAVADPGGRD